MPSVVSSSSTRLWACCQSPLASHQSAARVGLVPCGGASAASDFWNSATVIEFSVPGDLFTTSTVRFKGLAHTHTQKKNSQVRWFDAIAHRKGGNFCSP